MHQYATSKKCLTLGCPICTLYMKRRQFFAVAEVMWLHDLGAMMYPIFTNQTYKKYKEYLLKFWAKSIEGSENISGQISITCRETDLNNWKW